jgi:hypothetical protein
MKNFRQEKTQRRRGWKIFPYAQFDAETAGAGSNPAESCSQDEASANKKACNVSLKKKDKVAKDKKKTLKRL